jgi:SAM-dependent methyltransferase
VNGFAVWAARTTISISQHTPFRGKGDYTTTRFQYFEPSPAPTRWVQSEDEWNRFEEFFRFFAFPAQDELRGRTVLDLGSGFGGRSVGYALKCAAREVIGVEITGRQVETSAAYAQLKGAANCRFLLGSQNEIPLPSSSIDVVVTYDVLEHVANPGVVLGEVHRVLRTGGLALVVFTPYYGPFTHHLAYITRLPGLHWFFSADTLITAVNEILSRPGGTRFHPRRQPAPQWSHNRRRRCLPGLNGLTGTEFLALIEDTGGMDVVELRQMPLLERYRVCGGIGVLLNRALLRLGPVVRDALSFNLACVLRKTR